MRRRLVIGLVVYLALGVVFGLVTDRESYICPRLPDGEYVALPDNDITLVEVNPGCFPISSTADRLQWVATAAPGWLPLVVRNVVQGAPVQVGDIYLGDAI